MVMTITVVVVIINTKDIAVPGNSRPEEQERENADKYENLAIITRRLWKISRNAIPIVVGALGVVASLDECMNMLDVERKGG